MQQPAPAPAPAPPSVSGLPQAWVVRDIDVPRTGQEVEAIRIRLTDLRRELQDAAERRNSIASRMRSAPERAQPGLDARLAEVDGRIVGLEREITRNSALLQNATPEALVAGTSQVPDAHMVMERMSNELVPIVAILSVFVFGPIALAISRFFWKRSGGPARVAAPDHATQQKLEQLQQAVDTIAIEVERISEGQRFVTRLLNDRALRDGAAEPVAARKQLGAD